MLHTRAMQHCRLCDGVPGRWRGRGVVTSLGHIGDFSTRLSAAPPPSPPLQDVKPVEAEASSSPAGADDIYLGFEKGDYAPR